MSAPAPSSEPETAPLTEADVSVDEVRWTTGPTHREYPPADIVTVTGIRATPQEGFDRFIVDLTGDAFPTHHAEMTTGPAIQCGSGEPVSLLGRAVLTFRIEPAQAHDDAGASTLPARDLQTNPAALLETRLICDFEGQVEWAFGLANPTAYRILELTAPRRIVIDIQH